MIGWWDFQTMFLLSFSVSKIPVCMTQRFFYHVKLLMRELLGICPVLRDYGFCTPLPPPPKKKKKKKKQVPAFVLDGCKTVISPGLLGKSTTACSLIIEFLGQEPVAMLIYAMTSDLMFTLGLPYFKVVITHEIFSLCKNFKFQ